jgi:hypothetical protein
MNKNLSVLFIIVLLFSIFSTKLKAQDRIQSISTGISLIGVSNQKMSSYLIGKGFTYNNGSGNIRSYIKKVAFGSNTFMVSYKTQFVKDLAWTEHIGNLSNIMSEIKSLGFENGVSFSDTKIYSYKNYSRNILVSIIIRPDLNDCQIAIGKINDAIPIKKNSVKVEVTGDQNADESINYIVTAQKAFFYNSTANGSVGAKKQAYLVEGEKVVSKQELNGYIFCDFTNPVSKKTTKGWIVKSDVELVSEKVGEIQINKIEGSSPLASLIKLDGEGDVKKAYNNIVIIEKLKKIMGADYRLFLTDFLSNYIIGDIYVRHNILYIRSFVTHGATINATLFFDLKEDKCFLYWNTFDKKNNDLLKTYGDLPLSSGIVFFIKSFEINNKEFIDEMDTSLLDKILNYQK